MSRFGRNISLHVDAELREARGAEVRGDARRAFAHLERAHVLGQASTLQHVRVHWRMLRFGLERGDAREILGQLLRIVGAATKTVFGLAPELKTLIDAARASRG